MKPYKLMRVYHHKIGQFGSGLIVNNTFKPVKSMVSSVFKKNAKPFAKKKSVERNTQEKILVRKAVN